MLKEIEPIGHTRDRKGNRQSYVLECFVQFMTEVAKGTHPTQLGIDTRQALQITRHLKKYGIDFPQNSKEWGATPVERQVVCALQDGETTQREAARKIGTTHEDVRTHLSNLRKKKYPLPTMPRETMERRFRKSDQ